MLNTGHILPPPWIACPEIERYSIGWRMGYGESYAMRWSAWLDALPETEMLEYQTLFPEPVTWRGYWEDEDLCDYYEKDEFVMELWQKDGAPKYPVEKIIAAAAEKTLHYTFFWKPTLSPDGQLTNSCLSQWWKSDFRFMENTYCCMEQFMMAHKAELFGDGATRSEIMRASEPAEIMALGRQVKNFDEAVWAQAKYAVILNGNYCKFTQNPQLMDFLLSTGNSVLAEASPHDCIWGIGWEEAQENAEVPANWRGENLLGSALMEVRDEIRRIWKNANLCETIKR